MEKGGIQRHIIRKLMTFKPPKWGGSHTEEVNLVKGFPKHMRGEMIVKKAIEDLFKNGFLLRKMSTGEWHVSLNPEKKKEIMKFMDQDKE
mgnify:FL=1